MKTSNAKWYCPYCIKSIYGYGSEFELQEFIREHIASHKLSLSPASQDKE